MLQCPTGTYANETGQELCEPCPEGHECHTASRQPSLCRRGTYSSGGVSSCTPCPSGYFANYTGAVECESCPAGYSCQVASNRPMDCLSGTYRYVMILVLCAFVNLPVPNSAPLHVRAMYTYITGISLTCRHQLPKLVHDFYVQLLFYPAHAQQG